MGDYTICVYQFIYNEGGSFDTEIIRYFIMYGLGFFIKVDSYVAHMLYAWSFGNNTVVPISIKRSKNSFPWIKTPLCLLGDTVIIIKIECNN